MSTRSTPCAKASAETKTIKSPFITQVMQHPAQANTGLGPASPQAALWLKWHHSRPARKQQKHIELCGALLDASPSPGLPAGRKKARAAAPCLWGSCTAHGKLSQGKQTPLAVSSQTLCVNPGVGKIWDLPAARRSMGANLRRLGSGEEKPCDESFWSSSRRDGPSGEAPESAEGASAARGRAASAVRAPALACRSTAHGTRCWQSTSSEQPQLKPRQKPWFQTQAVASTAWLFTYCRLSSSPQPCWCSESTKTYSQH